MLRTLYPIFNDVQHQVYEVGSGTARTFEDVMDWMKVPYKYRE